MLNLSPHPGKKRALKSLTHTPTARARNFNCQNYILVAKGSTHEHEGAGPCCDRQGVRSSKDLRFCTHKLGQPKPCPTPFSASLGTSKGTTTRKLPCATYRDHLCSAKKSLSPSLAFQPLIPLRKHHPPTPSGYRNREKVRGRVMEQDRIVGPGIRCGQFIPRFLTMPPNKPLTPQLAKEAMNTR